MNEKDEQKGVLERSISKAEIQSHLSCCNSLISIDEAEPLPFDNNYEDCLIGKRDIL